MEYSVMLIICSDVLCSISIYVSILKMGVSFFFMFLILLCTFSIEQL